MLGAFLCFGLVKAQTVSGTVSDANGPLPGASVLVKGTTNGTQTDFDGNYTLNNVDDAATLVFSYIGYKTQEIAVNGQSTIDVTLAEDAQALDEVVIIGYGQTTVKDATGAVSAVTSEDFNQGVISSPEQLIQGKTSGVQITQSSGEPGAGIALRIRGTASVRSNNSPLFVIDGVPVTNESVSASGADVGVGSSGAKNPLNFLNPNDIESMSILKDASATAIYGSRGANGVVVITTKSGKGGGMGALGDALGAPVDPGAAPPPPDAADAALGAAMDGAAAQGGAAGADAGAAQANDDGAGAAAEETVDPAADPSAGMG